MDDSELFDNVENNVDSGILGRLRLTQLHSPDVEGLVPMGLPILFASEGNMIAHALEEPKDQSIWHFLEGGGLFKNGLSIELPGNFIFHVTKFKILILFAAVLVCFLFIRLAKRLVIQGRPQGKLDNFLEALLVMVRDQIAKPNLGDKTEKFLPFLWTLFSMILTINLIGMLPAPFFGCANASIAVTAAWALFTLVFLLKNGIASAGIFGYLKSFWIPIDVPVLGPMISLLLYFIEFGGVFLRIGVLSVRLFANMLGGHITLSLLFTFILMAAKVSFFQHAGVGLVSLFGAYLLSFLELFVAFLQAFIFTILSAVFIGTAVHEHEVHDQNDHANPDPTTKISGIHTS